MSRTLEGKIIVKDNKAKFEIDCEFEDNDLYRLLKKEWTVKNHNKAENKYLLETCELSVCGSLNDQNIAGCTYYDGTVIEKDDKLIISIKVGIIEE